MLFHGGDNKAALRDAGDNLLAIDGVPFNKVMQIAYVKTKQKPDTPGSVKEKFASLIAAQGSTLDIEPKLGWKESVLINESNLSARQLPPETLQFKEVSIADVYSNPPKPQGYVWGGRIPFGAATLLAAHGGTGKSLFALLLAICVAMGRECLGLQTASLKTIFFSAEDSVDTLRRRVAAICLVEGIDPVKLAENLTLVDATDAAVLFQEVNTNHVRFVAVSEVYQALKNLIDDNQIKFAVIDNASDVYAADPINRQYVTQFIRALVRLLPSEATDKAVLLLAHVNRVTAKAGKNQHDTEGYADSAAWHNATRSRLFLNAIDDAGGLELHHLKNNFGIKKLPLYIRFRPDGAGFYIPTMVVLDDEHGFSFGHKKALHLHVRLLVFRFIVTASKSLNRLIVRSRRLHEQGVGEIRLREYVQRWFIWLHSGLRNRVSHEGGFNRIWLFVLKYLNSGNKTSPS